MIAERERPDERIRYLRRAAQEQEAKRALRDFIRHQKEEDLLEEYPPEEHWDET